MIYVRDGDKAQGSWGRVFIYAQQPDGSNRVVTARSGRIDSSEDKSELVLSDAVATKIPAPANVDQRSYVVERLDQLRISINTGRAEILKRINEDEMGPEEMDWNELRKQASSGPREERRAGQRTLHRRLALAVSPFLFALLGGALGMKVRRGGRGIGVLLALLIVIVYYLVSLLGESLARVGTVSTVVGLWAASGLMLLLSFVLLAVNRIPVSSWSFLRFRKSHHANRARAKLNQRQSHTQGSRRFRLSESSGHWPFPDTGFEFSISLRLSGFSLHYFHSLRNVAFHRQKWGRRPAGCPLHSLSDALNHGRAFPCHNAYCGADDLRAARAAE